MNLGMTQMERRTYPISQSRYDRTPFIACWQYFRGGISKIRYLGEKKTPSINFLDLFFCDLRRFKQPFETFFPQNPHSEDPF